MRISQLDEARLTNDQMTRLLYDVHDDGCQGDCILVLGSNHAVQYRVPKAIELYRARRAPKILLSGGATWDRQRFPEALVMRSAVIAHGIAESDILVETQSKNTKENALCSLVTLDRAFQLHTIRRILIVTTTFHMRRAHLTFKTYMPNWISFSLCPVNDLTTRADNWWLHENGTRRVRDECKTLIGYVRSGYLIDQDI